jgi:CubicO group peptidase (beta-lactamase class C family)
VPGGREYIATKNFYDRPPGVRYAYSNIAVALAGYVAEAAGGTDFDRLCRERIIGPLGLRQTGFRLADISTRNLAMPYHRDKTSGEFLPYFQYGLPRWRTSNERRASGDMVGSVHGFRQVPQHSSTGADHGRGDQAKPDPTHRELGPGTDLVRQHIPWILPNGAHGRRLRDELTDVLSPDRRMGVVSITNAYLAGSRWAAFRDIELQLFDAFS